MATWTTPKQSWVGDDVVAASDMNNIGGDLQFLYDWSGSLGSASVTSSQGSITAEVDLTSLTVAVTVPAGGRNIKISAVVPVKTTVATDQAALYIKESTTYLQTLYAEFSGTGTDVTIAGFCVVTPSSGSHTYKLAMARAGSGTLTMDAASTRPAYILVEAL
jgi:hypothetical protein